MITLSTAMKSGQLYGTFVFYCVVSNSLYYCRVYLFIVGIKFLWILLVSYP